MTTATRVVCAFCPMLCDGAHTFTHATGHTVPVCEKCRAFITRHQPETADQFTTREESTMTHTADTLDALAQQAIDAIRAHGGASSWRMLRSGNDPIAGRRLYHGVCPVADFIPTDTGVLMSRNGETREYPDMATGAVDIVASMGFFNMDRMRSWVRVYPDSAEARELFA
jgi:hypothetical protein